MKGWACVVALYFFRNNMKGLKMNMDDLDLIGVRVWRWLKFALVLSLFPSVLLTLHYYFSKGAANPVDFFVVSYCYVFSFISLFLGFVFTIGYGKRDGVKIGFLSGFLFFVFCLSGFSLAVKKGPEMNKSFCGVEKEVESLLNCEKALSKPDTDI